MSLETWKNEFDPVPANDTTSEEALDHSIRKWEGLQPENLERHAVTLSGTRLTGADGWMPINSRSCALCFHHYDVDEDGYEDDGDSDDNRCQGCPLFRVRGGVHCDRERSGESVSPWYDYAERKNPQPMLTWLRRAKDAQR